MSASAQDLTETQRRIIADVQKATDMIDKHASSDNPSVSCWAGYWRRVRAQLIAAFLALIIVTGFAFPALAFDDFHFGDRSPPSYRKFHKRHHHAPKPGPRVKAWRFPDERRSPPDWFNEPPRSGCQPPVMASGIQGLTERGAEEKARDAWTADVRTKYGELWMDLRFADRMVKRCYRSSVGDNMIKSMRDRLQERIGIDDDGADANDAMEYRCDIWAIPCPPAWIGRGGDVKRDAEAYRPPPPGHGPLTSRRKWWLNIRVTR